MRNFADRIIFRLYLNRMNPLFPFGGEFRLHDSSRFCKKAGDVKFRFFNNFVPILIPLVAESSAGVGQYSNIRDYLERTNDSPLEF